MVEGNSRCSWAWILDTHAGKAPGGLFRYAVGNRLQVIAIRITMRRHNKAMSKKLKKLSLFR